MFDKEDVFTTLIAIVFIIFVVGVLVFACRCENNEDKRDWNDGYCECGGHWEYEQSVGHQYRTSYVFKCDKCGKHIEIWSLQIAEKE